MVKNKMKVLFVSSGRSGGVGEVVKNQGASLVRKGIEVDYYTIKPGLSGYLTAIPKIRQSYRNGGYDLVHAHYSLSAFSASIAGSFPLVVSLMGSDIYLSVFLRIVARLFNKYRWNATIVKTQQMKELLGMVNAHVIPNGVDIEKFKNLSKTEARIRIRCSMDKKLIIFISNPNRPEKNFNLAREAIVMNNNNNVELIPVYDVPNDEIPFYLNAADVLLLTSKWEGSVNVAKEAMACNCPIVSTDVGDVRWVVGETKGCFITSFEPEDVANKVRMALASGDRINGRQRIIDLGLDSETVAGMLIEVYVNTILHSKGAKVQKFS